MRADSARGPHCTGNHIMRVDSTSLHCGLVLVQVSNTRALSGAPTDPGSVFTTLNFLHNLQIGQISQRVTQHLTGNLLVQFISYKEKEVLYFGVR